MKNASFILQEKLSRLSANPIHPGQMALPSYLQLGALGLPVLAKLVRTRNQRPLSHSEKLLPHPRYAIIFPSSHQMSCKNSHLLHPWEN